VYFYLEIYQLLRFAATFNAVNLNHVLCQIDTNCRNVHFGRLFWFVEMLHLHIGTQKPGREGATIPLLAASRLAKRFSASGSIQKVSKLLFSSVFGFAAIRLAIGGN